MLLRSELTRWSSSTPGVGGNHLGGNNSRTPSRYSLRRESAFMLAHGKIGWKAVDGSPSRVSGCRHTHTVYGKGMHL